MTDEARWMLEGSHGMARDADAAVALLEAKSERRERKKDADRAEQLYQRASEQGNATSMLLMDKL